MRSAETMQLIICAIRRLRNSIRTASAVVLGVVMISMCSEFNSSQKSVLEKAEVSSCGLLYCDPGNARVNLKIRSALEENRDAEPVACDICMWGVCAVCILRQRNCCTRRNFRDLFLSRAEGCTQPIYAALHKHDPYVLYVLIPPDTFSALEIVRRRQRIFQVQVL